MLFMLRSISLLAIVTSVVLAADSPRAPSKSDWPKTEFTKVVGYRFKIPSDDAKGTEAVPSGFSLLNKTGLDTKQLETLTAKSTELTKPQIAKLLKATFNPSHYASPAACYDPHHIFVFYSDTGATVAAIEICFSCTGIATTPGKKKSQWYRHDFIALARLTDELGLWLEPRTLAQYEALQKERDKP